MWRGAISFLICGLILAAAFTSAEEPKPRSSRWATRKIERAGRLTTIGAAASLQAFEKASLRAGEAGHDFFLTALDFVEIQTAAIPETDIAFGQAATKQYFARARERIRSGQRDAAIKDLNACLKLDSKDAGAWFFRGGIWFDKKQFRRAVHDFDLAIKCQPLFSRAYEMRARCRLELGDERQALDDAAKAIQLDPQSSMFCSRAFMRVRLGDFRAALDDMNKAVELAPDDAFYCEVRGSVHNRLGKHDAAIADCDRALELDPKLAVAYLVRAVAKMAKGEYESANADFRSANELDPESFPLTQVPHKPSPIAADGTFERAASEYNTNAEESRSAGDFSPFYFQRLVYGQPPKEPLAPYGAEMGVDPDLAKRNIIAELCKIAWRAATSPDERYRDGIRASEKALEACKLTEFKDPRCVEALAAACAECGDFATAVRYQTLAIELHDNREQFRLARQPNKTPSSLLDLDGPDREQRRERLRLYRNRRAYRDAR